MLKLLHAADLHLDSPFAAFSPEEAAKLRGLQRQIPQMLIDCCREKQCEILLLAGDVFDGPRIYPETVEALRDAFGQWEGEVFIAPGNHDPATETSLWVAESWPENVHIFTKSWTSVALQEKHCRIWGAGFQSREAYDLLRPIEPAADLWEVGVLHGDPVNEGPYDPISAESLETCGLHYLALGHIHKGASLQKAGSTFYGWPGCPMGRGFDECGQKGVWYVQLDETGCRQEFVPLSLPRFEILTADAEALTVPPEAEGSICCLVLTGEADGVDTEYIRRQLADRFLHLEVRDATTPRRNPWADCGSNTLRGIALSHLKKQYEEGEEAEKNLYLQAAKILLAALEGREQP